MLLKLDGETDKLAGRINKKTVKEMVNAYRKKPSANQLCYAHFGLEEVIQLFIENGVMSSGAMSHIIKDRGVKIYIGQHTHIDNCPPRRSDYVGCDTAIVCTTIIRDPLTFRYEDQLTDRKDSILVSVNRLKSGEALDQSSTYPPDNPYNPAPSPMPNPPEIYDIDY